MPDRTAIVGIADHGGWAIVVSLASDGTFLDRRRVELLDEGLPPLPHHHEAQWALGRTDGVPWARQISLPEALVLIERVRTSAHQRARASLELLESVLPVKLGKLALRQCPTLPPSVEQRIEDYRAQTMADSVMYREALAAAAASKGLAIDWYDRKLVFDAAARCLGVRDIRPVFEQLRAALGPPWQADHKLATAAAIVAGGLSECRALSGRAPARG